jgi:serine/threonine protein kinase
VSCVVVLGVLPASRLPSTDMFGRPRLPLLPSSTQCCPGFHPRCCLACSKRMLAEDTADPAAATQAADSKSMLETDSCWDSSGAPAFVPAAELTGRTGSFGYMAPEVLHSRQYDAAVDIFSLGMCM